MAIYAIDIGVHAVERKAIVKVDTLNVIHQPVIRSMTAGTVVSQRHLVYIGVARDTIYLSSSKHQRLVAISAVDCLVTAHQRKPGIIMGKFPAVFSKYNPSDG